MRSTFGSPRRRTKTQTFGRKTFVSSWWCAFGPALCGSQSCRMWPVFDAAAESTTKRETGLRILDRFHHISS